jgi:hypothetical protein
MAGTPAAPDYGESLNTVPKLLLPRLIGRTVQLAVDCDQAVVRALREDRFRAFCVIRRAVERTILRDKPHSRDARRRRWLCNRQQRGGGIVAADFAHGLSIDLHERLA